ncbi:cytochrome c biogenesis heme-transporting ATPase CcmA [Mesosutterella sp. OilRF-GAM-744-9]|uniref:Cytochrome c biogenesis heme-transporting ATPase CcmA n=1 Tax=Mesosutterella porci TaxID=2915351 RepID=A0ABS9MSB8_9BURK|nr:cytochrome c biogenesis heme-transporting ATPase CcmA [Mesosutterella sp. oilRF-744-WT-GAM-9]MCG5031427.1 cytochrome c biogenesis heme-transporting ATPase CcmA [Mesosutterella sp. oilRF-744-WT-GAM-9]
MNRQEQKPLAAPQLTLRGVACVRGERCLYRGLSLEARAGAVVRLFGENGAGKTTLMRIITGLLEPESGEVLWRGRPIRELGGDYRAELLYIGHMNGLKEELSCLENLRVNAALFGRPADEGGCREALRRVGLAGYEDEPARSLSQGQHRRAALARLYLSEPVPLWILDEPFTALDPRGVEALCRLIEAHAASGGITVMTTHQASGLSAPGYFEFDVSAFAPGRKGREARHA